MKRFLLIAAFLCFSCCASAATVTFIRTDTTTSGTWLTAYGTSGYALPFSSSLPSLASVSVGGLLYTYADPTSDVRALQKPSGGRAAATWYGDMFATTITITDANVHQLALYVLDWDGTSRSETIAFSDTATSQTLDTRTMSGFHNGVYAVYSVSGNITIRITGLAGPNAVLNGIFLDPIGNPSPTPTPTPSPTPSPTPTPIPTPTPTPSPGAPPAGPIPASLFGMNLVTPLPGGSTTAWPTVPVGALGKGSFITWPYLEPSNGVFDWRTLDALSAMAQTHNVPFTIALEGAPGWAVSDQSTCSSAYGYTRCTGMPDLIALDTFITALATRYAGKITAYELYNEPDIPGAGNGFAGTVAQLVTLTQHEYADIRAVDPSALISSPSGGAAYMDSYFAAGGVKTVDALDFHLYPDPGQYTTPNYAAAERIKYWTDAYRTMWAKYGLTQQVWETEGSWNLAQGTMADPDQQAAFVARWYLLHWSTGISRGFWYAWNSDTYGTLWDVLSGEHKPANAYRQVQSWMVGATMPASCATSGTSVMFGGQEPAQYACALTRSGGYHGLAIWNTNGPTSYTPDPMFTSYRDLNGNVTPISGAITVGYKPILLENTGTPSNGPIVAAILALIAQIVVLLGTIH